MPVSSADRDAIEITVTYTAVIPKDGRTAAGIMPPLTSAVDTGPLAWIEALKCLGAFDVRGSLLHSATAINAIDVSVDMTFTPVVTP